MPTDFEPDARTRTFAPALETLVKARLLAIAIEIERKYGAQESDWDMAQIWRDFNNGELEPLYEGLIKADAKTAAETVHNALYSRKTNALRQCIADAKEAAETQTDGFKRKECCCSANYNK